MNFLSHYYLHNDINDNYFTVGLTMPDLLGFHSRRIRVTKKILKEVEDKESDNNLKSHIYGMMLHLDLDRWFHNSTFFKGKVIFLQSCYVDFNAEGSALPHFYAHILLEILLDRYLLKIEPDIADKFYDSYKRFNFSKVSKIFLELKNFHTEKFLSLANKVAHSTFLKEYVDDYSIISILTRVSNRIEIPMTLKPNNDDFARFIKYSYDELELSFKSFFINAKDETAVEKDEINKYSYQFTVS